MLMPNSSLVCGSGGKRIKGGKLFVGKQLDSTDGMVIFFVKYVLRCSDNIGKCSWLQKASGLATGIQACCLQETEWVIVGDNTS